MPQEIVSRNKMNFYGQNELLDEDNLLFHVFRLCDVEREAIGEDTSDAELSLLEAGTRRVFACPNLLPPAELSSLCQHEALASIIVTLVPDTFTCLSPVHIWLTILMDVSVTFVLFKFKSVILVQYLPSTLIEASVTCVHFKSKTRRLTQLLPTMKMDASVI
jgi:hypothetical protein